MSRRCDAIRCTANVASGRFMCLKHWRLVPLDLQRTINSRYRALRKDFAFLSDVLYLSAATAAIDGIAVTEGHMESGLNASANPYRRHLAMAEKKAKERGATT